MRDAIEAAGARDEYMSSYEKLVSVAKQSADRVCAAEQDQAKKERKSQIAGRWLQKELEALDVKKSSVCERAARTSVLAASKVHSLIAHLRSTGRMSRSFFDRMEAWQELDETLAMQQSLKSAALEKGLDPAAVLAAHAETPIPEIPGPAAETVDEDRPAEAPLLAVPNDGPAKAPSLAVPNDGPAEAAVPNDGPAEAPSPNDGPAEAPVPNDGPAEAPSPNDGPAEAPVPNDGPAEAPSPNDGPAEAPSMAVPNDGPAEAPTLAVPNDGPAEAPTLAVPNSQDGLQASSELDDSVVPTQVPRTAVGISVCAD